MYGILNSYGRAVRRFVAAVFTLLTAAALAQGPAGGLCAGIVQAALQAADQACSGTGRNQVCYGNVLGEATPADGITDLRFENVGDVASLTQISALQLSPLDEAAQQWGVALMQVQANLPDALPGQNVTFLLFGDVGVEDAVGQQARIPTAVLRTSNVRLRPTTDGRVVGSLGAGAVVDATGKYRNSAGELWIRVKYDDYRTGTGWVYGSLLDVAFESLPDVPADSLVMNPMQAFYFRPGIGRPACAEAPTDGVVVQTPEGVGLVNFNVNGVNVTLGSTAVLGSDGGSLRITLLEGTGAVESDGVARRLVPGAELTVPLDANGLAAGIPSMPEPIDPERFGIVSRVLKITPRDVTVPEAAKVEVIRAANPIAPNGTIRIDITVPSCPQGSDPAQCACNDVDGDGRCDAVPCSEKYPTMCVPGCRDADGDGKCDLQCPDQNGDGHCDDSGGCGNTSANAGCAPCAGNPNGACSNPTPAVDCLIAGPVICDPTCENRDGDEICDSHDSCIDVNNDGKCDQSCGDGGETAGCEQATPTPYLGKNGRVPPARPTSVPNK